MGCLWGKLLGRWKPATTAALAREAGAPSEKGAAGLCIPAPLPLPVPECRAGIPSGAAAELEGAAGLGIPAAIVPPLA